VRLDARRADRLPSSGKSRNWQWGSREEQREEQREELRPLLRCQWWQAPFSAAEGEVFADQDRGGLAIMQDGMRKCAAEKHPC
jgi:hypothetical protein